VAKAEWGRKRNCQSCGTAFYDMQKSPIVCPKCGTEFNPEQILKARRGGSAEDSRARKVVPKPVAVLADDDVLIEDDDILIPEESDADADDSDFIADDETIDDDEVIDPDKD
jgi:hypothetical protein